MSEPAPAIVVRDLVKRFGAFAAVDHVSLSVARGEVFGFLGPNGCGKSTTIRMICGLLGPTSGSIEVAGLDVRTHAEQIRARVGYVAQFFNLYRDLTVYENLTFYGGVYGVPRAELRSRVEHWCERLDLSRYGRVLSGELSTGVQRSLALAAAVLHEPAVLLLDEPTSGVDPIARRAFFDVIGELADGGTSILVTTHVMDEADRCGRLALMDRGKLVAEGTPSEIRAMGGTDIWQVSADPPSRALTLAEQHPGVDAPALFGTRLQFRVSDGTTAVAVAQWLRDQGVTCDEPRPVRATIEHAFLQLLRRDDGDNE
ncbi:MAG: ABC transporter ATP-binding protein [Armatimonadetes bacterium]|nr:ABC transporter ATP-binding protein [Armatimonadota bacterium]